MIASGGCWTKRGESMLWQTDVKGKHKNIN